MYDALNESLVVKKPRTKPSETVSKRVQDEEIFPTTGRERLIRSHSSARFCFELSGNSN